MTRISSLSLVVLAALAACNDVAREPTSPAALTPQARTAVLTQSDGAVIMTNLANPRGLAWGPDGALYVAEAGRGGTAPCMIVLGTTVCYGATGGISRLRDGVQERVVSDLPSWVQTTNANGTVNRSGRAQGPNGLSFHGFGNGYVAIGLEADPAERVTPELMGLGQLVRLSPTALVAGPDHGGKKAAWEFVADVAGYEQFVNPDCGDIDSNPFGVFADAGGVYVADAGGNYILRRDANGDLSTAAVFSNNTTTHLHDGCPPTATRDFVPTSITKGPDGAFYIGHLNGLTILPGSSSIWRLEPGGVPTVYCTGFTWIIGLSFDQNGDIYVLQHADGITQGIPNPNTSSPGTLHKVHKVDADSPACTDQTVAVNLFRPTGVLADDLGNVYVSLVNGTNFAGEGRVVRFTP